jgi:hypothetical protein
MAFGDNAGAIGELVGEENRGIEYMFTMMNNARLSVGIEGLAIAERAYQQARDHAKARLQGRAVDSDSPTSVPIIRHPDVRRMLMTMRAQIEAMRALVAFVAGSVDRARRHPEAAERARHQTVVDLLTPVVKAWCTDTGCAVTSMAVQVHGGLGFIESTGAAQHFRDARIAPIYEGTNGIQAIDLVSRKLARDDGTGMRALISAMRTTVAAAGSGNDGQFLGARLDQAIGQLSAATDWLAAAAKRDRMAALAVASPYLALVGTVAGGWLLARSALAAGRQRSDAGYDGDYLAAKESIARFYAATQLPQAGGLSATVLSGADSTLALTEDQF